MSANTIPKGTRYFGTYKSKHYDISIVQHLTLADIGLSDTVSSRYMMKEST